MASDPLKEVLQKLVKERREQIDRINTQLKTTFDPIVRDDLQKQLAPLHSELRTAELALQQQATVAQPAPQPQQPQPQPHPQTPQEILMAAADAQLLKQDFVVAAPKSPSKASLEAQIRELQTQLLDASLAVEKGGASPNPMDVAHLKEVREKLQNAMQQVAAAEIGDFGELPPKPTTSQLSEADNLIKRSLLEKRRGNSREAGDLLRQAADIAPGSPTVLETLGDDIMERGQPKAAAEIFGKALRIQPNNPNIERKYALAIARSKAAVTAEEALQMSLGNSSSAAETANWRIAAVLSFFIPGGGQIIMGDYVKGGVLLGTWVIMLLWISIAKNQWQDLVKSIAGKSQGFDPLILIPVVTIIVLGIAAAFTCNPPEGPQPPKKVKGPRPKPPVDLPF